MGARPRNVQNELPEASWEPFGEQAPEMLKMNLQKYPESHLGSSAQKRPIAFPLFLFTIKKEEVSILLLDLGPKGPPQGGPNGPQGGPERARPIGPAR